MNKLLKYTLIGFGGLVVLLVAGAVVLTLTFDPNAYKPMIVKLVKEKKQRTLDIEGDIKLAFWPKLGADLGRVRLSEHNSDKEFASMDGAKVFVAVMPLLHKQLVVDTVRVDGVKANIVRHADGTTNLDDLLGNDEEPPSEEVAFDIDGVKVSNSALTLSDEKEGRHIAISGMELQTGHVAKNEPIDLQAEFAIKSDKPALDAKVKFKGTLLADAENKRYGAQGMNLSVNGDVAMLKAADIQLSGDVEAKPEQTEYNVADLKLALKAGMEGKALEVRLDAPSLSARDDQVSSKQATLDVTQKQGADVLTAHLVIDNLKGSPKAFQSSGIRGDITGKQGARTIAGKFSSPFSGDLENMVFDLPKLAGQVDVKDPALPRGAMQASFAVNARADVKQEQANVGLDADIDGAKVNGKVAVAGFDKPAVKFDLTADKLDLNQLLGSQEKPRQETAAAGKPADLSALKDVRAQGSLKIGSLVYDKYRIANLNMSVKADGQALTVSPLSAKLDDSQIKGSVGIRNFSNPLYVFDLDIDKLDADRYMSQDEGKQKTQQQEDKPIDLSALKTLNAEGSLRIGWLKLANVKTTNVRLTLKAKDGQASLAPFSANLYQGAMAGSLNVDARTTPALALKQEMKGIQIGPLLQDAINNDMLEGKGTLSVDVKAQGATADALKKGLNGTAAVNLVDGAIKGFDLAGTLRNAKSKLNVLKGESALGADQSKKTDFSEMKASFNIRNGVAHNNDLDIKSPLFRIGGSGDIDIGNEKLNYVAKPTVVATLKGQGGSELADLNGLTIPVKVTGTFSDPKYGPDFAAMGTALAKQKLLEKVGGEKAAPLEKLMGGDKAGALESLIGGKKSAQQPAPAEKPADSTAPAEEPKQEKLEDQLKKKLKLPF